jgi:nitrous oxidase accessory protein
MIARRLLAVAVAGLPLLLPLAGPALAHEGHEMHPASEIQARIDAASPGATIVIEAGSYHGDLVVDRAVTLQGEGRPLIHGTGTGSVILVTGDGAVVRGLRVQNSAIGPVGGPAGIRVEADHVLVEDNVIEETYMGVAVFGGEVVKILDNVIRGRLDAVVEGEAHAADPEGVSAQQGEEHADHGPGGSRTGRVFRGDGISLWNAPDTVVRGNVVEHSRDGIFMSFSDATLIDSNRILDSRYAVHSMYAADLMIVENGFEENLSSAVLMYGGPVTLLRNRLLDSTSGSTGFGLLLKDVAGADVVENVIVGNRVGVQVDGPAGDTSHPIVIRRNTVAMNRFGVSLYPSAHATFTGNSFVENTVQVVAQGHGVAGKNTWYDDGMGNYWSDYRGYDITGEGLGDVPHHEGGTVEHLMVESPVLQALASGPAFGLLRAVEDRWIEHEPVVVDPLPILEPVSPMLAEEGSGGPAAAVMGALGLAAVGAAAAVLVALRRPLRRGSRGRVRHAT